MSIQPQSIAIPPGVVSVPTKTSKSASWAETNLMRWVSGKMSPIGGWSKLGYPAFASPLRYIHRWSTNAGLQITAYLCTSHLYVDYGSGLQDVSPTSAIVPPPSSTAGGYGDYEYNFGVYNTPRPNREPIEVIPPSYKLDNWGENLLAMTSTDGRLLQWDPNTPSVKAVAAPGAPVNNRTFVVTPQRHVLLFGAGGSFNHIQWCDEEDLTNWSLVDITSKGGDYSLQPASAIVTAEMSGADIVFFTAGNNAYVINYLGLPYVYGFEQFNSDAVPMSPKAVINTPMGAIWASTDGFWYFSGNSAVSLVCPVWSWVDDQIDYQLARSRADFVIIPSYSELYFFFPAVGSEVNNRYVVFNYKDGWWATGNMQRACGVKSIYTGYPVMSDGVSVFQHEYGSSYSLLPGEDLPWARTFNINFAGGSNLLTVGRMIADVGGADTSDLTFSLDYNIERSGARTPMNSGEKPLVGGYVFFRDSGRDFRMTIKQNSPIVKDWTMGDNILETVPRGRL